jgi:hypothetical protein
MHGGNIHGVGHEPRMNSLTALEEGLQRRRVMIRPTQNDDLINQFRKASSTSTTSKIQI